ncbi:flagellar motor protein MotB [Sandarakinorhabdus sp. AAP62]|uniref:flagellar motor protein MotB n=1 Tax=Sandarakinorhabdus sp. AAP62 TaxID=1248916 RepID=UPI0002EE0D8C|nr:flagellar motor protein MotB [Sandarakinorhabdus sp. AAP62]
MKPELNIEPEVIIKKAKGHGHAHHGGAWKIAYADFVTAMMAFFMLLWILGATNEQQRKGIADYFTPTVIQMQNSGGSNGLFGGRSVTAPDGASIRPETTGRRPVTAAGSDSAATRPGVGEGSNAASGQQGQASGNSGKLARPGDAEAAARAAAEARARDDAALDKAAQRIMAKLEADPTLKGLKGQVRFVKTRDGLRIDLVERADFSMFGLGTAAPTSDAGELVQTVAHAIEDMPNNLTVRGHTDALGFSRPGGTSNWSLSTARADATRRLLMGAGIPGSRFRRIEGVADTDPYVKDKPNDPRNRRISVTLLYQDPA